MERAEQALKEIFGFEAFRLAQREVIERLLVDNENALVVFPTGGGKSLTFQVPALCLDGLTLVITPLISLMKDQVEALLFRGVKAAKLDSTLTAEEAARVKSQALDGTLKLLYVAPERLNNEGFIEMMKRVKISLLAIDESHCISMWGASFRPEYLKIARFAEEMDVERVLCLTATATVSVIKDICEKFFIHKVKGVFRTPVFRPNLSFQVDVAASLSDKIKKIIPLLNARTGPSIIYVTQQKHTEEASNQLKAYGIDSMVYHAGLPKESRDQAQQSFMESAKGVVVATIAFGMGIDKANIRQVIHLHMPKTLENYSQEVGRAGRDGLPSTCLMFLSHEDMPVLESFARGDTCAKRDVGFWIKEVAAKKPYADNTVDFSHFNQSKIYDIRSNVLGLLYAQLELDYGYIRAVTPYYSVYAISEKTAGGWKKVLADRSKAADEIRKNWGTRFNIDVADAAAWAGMNPNELTKKINGWELDGYITTKASQVRARYLLLEKPMPQELDDVMKVADELHERMVARETEAIEKMEEVLAFATADECLPVHLARYFGDNNVVPNDKCGQCTFCTTGKRVDFVKMTRSASTLDQTKIQRILQACPERDDPRLLARMAFGITSPRLTANKWSTMHPAFGIMGDTSFSILLEAFEAECAKCNYERDEAVAASLSLTGSSSTGTKKRKSDGDASSSAPAAKKSNSSGYSYSKANSSSGGYGGSGYGRSGGGGYSRGGGYKRGRGRW